MITLFEALNSSVPFYLTDDSTPPDAMYGRFEIDDKEYAVAIERTGGKGLYQVSFGRAGGKNVSWWRLHSNSHLIPVMSTIVSFAQGFLKSEYDKSAIAFYLRFPKSIVNDSNIKQFERLTDRIIKSKFSSLELIPVSQPRKIDNLRSIFIAKKGVDYRKVFQTKIFKGYDISEKESDVTEEDLSVISKVQPSKNIVGDKPSTKYSFAGFSIDVEDIEKAYLSKYNELEGIASGNSNVSMLKSNNPKDYYRLLGYFRYILDITSLNYNQRDFFASFEKEINKMPASNRIIYEFMMIMAGASLDFKILANSKNSNLHDAMINAIKEDGVSSNQYVKEGYQYMKDVANLFSDRKNVYEIAALNETINPIIQFVYIGKNINPNQYAKNISIFAQSTSKADNLIPGYNLNAPWSNTEVEAVVKELKEILRFKKLKILESKKEEYSQKLFGKTATPFYTDEHYIALRAVLEIACRSMGVDSSDISNPRQFKNILTSFKDLAKFNYSVMGQSTNLVNMENHVYQSALDKKVSKLPKREKEIYDRYMTEYAKRANVDIILANPKVTTNLDDKVAISLIGDLKSEVPGMGELNLASILDSYGNFNIKDFELNKVLQYFQDDYVRVVSSILADPNSENHKLLAAVKTYTGSSYKTINKPLREMIKEILSGKMTEKKMTSTQKNIIKAFDVLPPTKTGFYVWRNAKVPLDVWDAMKPGDSYVDAGVMSATLSKDMKFNDSGSNTRFMIWIPKGSKVIPMLSNSNHPSEHEVVLRPMSIIKILKVEQKPNSDKKMVIGTYVGTAIKSVMKTKLLESDNRMKTFKEFL